MTNPFTHTEREFIMSNLTLAKNIDRLARMAGDMEAGDDLRRTHYTQAMGGSQWRTLQAYLLDLQNGVCALTGMDMRRARADQPDALTLHLLVPSVYWGTDEDKQATTANNGKALDPYRFGFVPGNVVLAVTAASHMVRSERARVERLMLTDAEYAPMWTAEMKRAAKIKAPAKRDDLRRILQGQGWSAEG